MARVSALVAAVAGPDRMPPGAGPDTPLGDDGYWLDSVDVFEVILAAEAEFGVALGDEDELTDESLTSIRTLSEAISRQLG